MSSCVKLLWPVVCNVVTAKSIKAVAGYSECGWWTRTMWLCVHAESQESSNMYFCFRWLLILFKREFSFPEIMRIWEVSRNAVHWMNLCVCSCVCQCCHLKCMLLHLRHVCQLIKCLKNVHIFNNSVSYQLVLIIFGTGIQISEEIWLKCLWNCRPHHSCLWTCPLYIFCYKTCMVDRFINSYVKFVPDCVCRKLCKSVDY